MSTEISIYKIKRKELFNLFDICGGNSDDILHDSHNNLNFSCLYNQLKKYELDYFCGRNFVFDNLYLFERNYDNSFLIGSKLDFDNLVLKSKDILTKYRVLYDEMLQIPLNMLKDYIKRAEDNDEVLVSFPLEGRSDYSNYINEYDYYQAERIVEIEKNLSWDDDDILFIIHSY